MALVACGSRTALRGQPYPDGARPDSGNPPNDVPNSPEVTVVCPAPVFGRQTETATLAATARSNVGRPLTFAWTVDRAPMGSTATPTPPDATTTHLTFDTGGEWLLRFTARDDAGRESACTVRAFAQAAIELLCPNDQSNYEGATVSLAATATSRFMRPLTFQWTVESRPPGSNTAPTPPASMAPTLLLDQLGDWRLRLTATDSAGLTQSCVTNVHADPDVIVMCPPDTVSRPFAAITLTGTASSRLGLPLTYRWEIVEHPVTSTAALGAPTQISTPFTFDVAGDWTYRFTATNPRGNAAYCTTRARSASSEAVRVEIVWNIDRSCTTCNAQGGGIDIDLHLADVARAQGHWANLAPASSDCYYANCQCRMPGMLCPVDLIDWPPTGRANNPQLDIDHIGDLPGPENINVPQAEVGSEFDVGVHFFGSRESSTPVVARVYCGGTIVFESEVVRFERGGGGSNNLWRVGRITTTPGGCAFARCGGPGNLSACIPPESSW
jgi:hypothetical protein